MAIGPNSRVAAQPGNGIVSRMTVGPRLAEQAWPDLQDLPATLVVPLGAVEQHGPHLPLDTDIRIATAVAVGAVDIRREADPQLPLLVAPGLPYGASGEHEGFPGTVSIGAEALHLLLVEFGRSACRWAQRLVFVNAHGGNNPTLAEAVALLRYEGRDAAWFPCAVAGADAHAGATETSMLLDLAPAAVREDRVEVGCTDPITDLLPQLRAGGVAAVSESGILGDPRAADRERGAAMLRDLTAKLSTALESWQVDETGRLGWR